MKLFILLMVVGLSVWAWFFIRGFRRQQKRRLLLSFFSGMGCNSQKEPASLWQSSSGPAPATARRNQDIHGGKII
jgi:hypothetical protein